MFQLSSRVVVWSCKKWNMVSLCTIEAKYHGVIHVGTKAMWILHPGELGFPIKTLVVLYCDNESAIQVVDNLVTHSKKKHVELRAHYLRQRVQEKVVNPIYYNIDDQVVDIFMKYPPKSKFVKLWDMLRLQEVEIMGGGT